MNYFIQYLLQSEGRSSEQIYTRQRKLLKVYAWQIKNYTQDRKLACVLKKYENIFIFIFKNNKPAWYWKIKYCFFG